MKKFALSSIFFLTAAVANAVIAQPSAGPKMPFIDKGACPFECCTYRRWDVKTPTIVRAAMKDSSAVAFRLKRGESVQGLTGAVITTRPGIVRVLKDTTLSDRKLKKGDDLFLLTYLGEGFNKIWHRGKLFDGDPYDPATYKVIQEPRSTWWVKVRNKNGKTGWSRQPENFGNMDQCG